MEPVGMRQVGDRFELTGEEQLVGSRFYNEDLAPTKLDQRTWGKWNIAALWVGMSVCVPTYMLAAGLIQSGMTWWQAVLTVLTGNLLVLIPMILNAHAGTKYGIPFPVFLRAPFGTLGSNVPALLRALVACGWFGIQTWIGGAAIYILATKTGFAPEWADAKVIGFLGINQWQLICFLAFWAINIGVILAGIESIKWLETFSAPLLLAIGLALLGWGISQGGGLGVVLARSESFQQASLQAHLADPTTAEFRLSPATDAEGKPRATQMQMAVVAAADAATLAKTVDDAEWVPYKPAGTLELRPFLSEPVGADDKIKLGVRLRTMIDGKPSDSSLLQVDAGHRPRGGWEEPTSASFWLLFLPALTGMVGFWATLSLNIADFTRYARTQKDQVLGQAIGLPTTMALFTFIGVTVTCASIVIFKDILIVEDALWDPVALLGRFTTPWVVVVSMIALAVATLSTNIAANVVSPANDFSNIAPRLISFRMGGVITGVIGILIMPWKLLESTQGYIFTWLIGYGTLLGPIGGIMIADYYLVRRTRLPLADLYKEDGTFRYTGGFSIGALVVLLLAILPNVPGFLLNAGFATRPTLVKLFSEEWTGYLEAAYSGGFFVGFGVALVLYTIVGYATGRHKQAG